MNILPQPTETEKLRYNEATKQYELKPEFIKSELEVTYIDDRVLDQRIKKNSRTVYGYIYAHGNAANRHAVEFFINRTTEGQEFIFDALFSQMEADLQTGYNSIGETPRVNIKNGQVIDEAAMVQSLVSLPTKQILENSEGYTGINLLCQVKYDWYIFAFVKGYK